MIFKFGFCCEVFYKILYQPVFVQSGTEWTPSHDACNKFICTTIDGQYVTTNHKIHCPPFNIDYCQPVSDVYTHNTFVIEHYFINMLDYYTDLTNHTYTLKLHALMNLHIWQKYQTVLSTELTLVVRGPVWLTLWKMPWQLISVGMIRVGCLVY